ncbi:MAG: putative transposase, partial [bacterium]
VRKLTERGHQTAILATDYRSNIATLAAHMFSRWFQENFFKSMREHFNLDRLIDYSVDGLSALAISAIPCHL